MVQVSEIQPQPLRDKPRPWSRVFPLGGLASEQKRLRILSFAANLEGTEVLVPRSTRRLGFRLPPRLQLVEVLGGDLALAQPLEQVVAKRRRKSGPPDLRHHSPKVMRASSSLRRFCSSGSRERERRSANSKKRFFSCSRASSPDSMRSAMMRLVLVLLVCASDFTRRATRAGRLTL